MNVGPQSWIFCTPIPVVLRIHLSMYGKAGVLTEEHQLWINFSVVCRLKKSITKMYSCNRIVFLLNINYGRSFNKFVTFRADDFETLVSRASRLRDFLGEVPSVTPISSNLSSVSTVRFQSGFLSSSVSIISSLLTSVPDRTLVRDPIRTLL
jgi:hypothetical protein